MPYNHAEFIFRRIAMKNCFFVILAALLFNTANAAAKALTYNEEMYALGSVSGQGLACKSQKYHQFEQLARAIMVGKAANSAEQKQGMERYNTGKVEAFMAMEDSNFKECDIILEEFERQKIFDSTLYADGRVKLYDGTMITPRKPYDATKLYKKDREAFLKADAAYKKYIAEGQKAGQNAKKIPLYDANYSGTDN